MSAYLENFYDGIVDLSLYAFHSYYDVTKKNGVAVISHAYNSDFWFDYWYRHYSEVVGAENLFIFTENPESFKKYDKLNVIGLPGWDFNDLEKSGIANGLMWSLLFKYKYIIVCDIDEIIFTSYGERFPIEKVLDNIPFQHSLRTFGIDIIHQEGDSNFDFTKKILEQRDYGYVNTNTWKASIHKSPVYLDGGYHASSKNIKIKNKEPYIYLFHLRFSDYKIEKEMMDYLSNKNKNDEKLSEYFYLRKKSAFPKNLKEISYDDFIEQYDPIKKYEGFTHRDPGSMMYRQTQEHLYMREKLILKTLPIRIY